MNATLFRIVGVGLPYLLILLTGFWLTGHGKPYSTLVLTFHKLLMLAAIVLLVLFVRQAGQVGPLAAREIAACAVTGLSLLAAIVSGALLSGGKPLPGGVLLLHRAGAVLTVLSTSATLRLLQHRH